MIFFLLYILFCLSWALACCVRAYNEGQTQLILTFIINFLFAPVLFLMTIIYNKV